MPRRIDLPESELRELYLNQRLSLTAVAQRFSVSSFAIVNNMRRYGIPTRNLSESHKGQKSSPATQFKPGQRPHNRLDLPEETIAALYRDNGLSCTEIARTYGVDHKVILRILTRQHVPRKGATVFNTGKKHSEETRRRLSLAHKGRPQPQLQSSESRRRSTEGVRRAHAKRFFGWRAIAARIRAAGGTDAELYLARLLQEAEIPFEREFTVSTDSRRRYSLDFAWPNAMLDVELDGNSHIRTAQKDRNRDKFLSAQGWHVIRVSNADLFESAQDVVARIRAFLEKPA